MNTFTTTNNNNIINSNCATGLLTVKIVSADLKKDKDIILKQDPYCVIKFGGRTFKTKTHIFGGKHPSWSDVFTMKKTNEDMLQVSVFDKDLLSKDDFLGAGAVAIGSLMNQGRYTTWINLNDAGKYTGKVLIETEFKPDVVAQNTQQQFTQQTQQQLTQQTQPQCIQKPQPSNQYYGSNQTQTMPVNDFTKKPNYGLQNDCAFCPTTGMPIQKQFPTGYQGQQPGLYPDIQNAHQQNFQQQGYPQQKTFNQGSNLTAPYPPVSTNQGFQGQQLGFNGTQLQNAKPYQNQFSFN